MLADDLETRQSLWDALRTVCAVHFVAYGSAATGWSGIGDGTVLVEDSPDVILFREVGTWRQPGAAKPLPFTNVYRWTLRGETIRLEHLRFGVDRPVYLFDLTPGTGNVWSSLAPHSCGEDEYTAEVRLTGDILLFDWAITGPRKQERIEYVYQLKDKRGGAQVFGDLPPEMR